ncbi:MAG: hypothetical protein FWH41_02625, partial [Treponema sp.]|nr:hypothetical protein [Treponema sp.]
ADVDKAKAGDTVTLTATPESGYLLDSLTVTKAGGGVVATTATVLGSEYTFEMPVDDVTVTASFSNEPVFYITVDSAITNGTVIPDAPMATEGTTVTLTVEPDEKYMLSTLTITMGSGGTVTPAEVTAGSEYTFEMPGEDVEITASFILDPDYEYVITIDSAIEDGEVTADVDKAKAGDTVTLTATADSGYVLSAITVTKAGGGAVSTTPVTPGIEYTFEMPDDDVEVTAEFSSEPVYDITINSAMTNGAVTPDTPIATEGTTVTLTVTPDSGYLFSSITVTKDGGGTVATTTVTAGSVYTFIMPDDHVIVTAVFAALPYPLAIDDFAGRAASAPPTNYVYAGNSADPGWAIVTTDGRTHLWANVEPNTVTGSRFGRSAALDVNISDYISDPTAVILLDIRVGGSPYTYTFELTVNGTVYSTQIIGVQPGLDILHAIPLSQLVNAGTSMADLTGTVTVSSWAISCTAVAGLTGTRVYCISLDSVQSRTVTKGTVTGPAGNDFSIPASTQVPVGNAVPIGLTLAPSNRFLVLNFTPVVSVVQGKASLTIAYFIMPDANVTVGAEFELIPEPEMWVIEDISGAAARGITGWMGDWFNDTFGYWGVNIPLNWGGSAAQSGPNWFAANFGDAAEASNYVAVNPINRWIMQIETWTNLSVGRNLPSAMDISGKDTIRILLRRSGSITLQLGLFNGGQPLDGYQNPGGQAVAPTGGTIDIVKSGTGYWVAIPANTNSTNLASSTWDYLEIPLSSFTSQGFNPALLTGWGIRDMDTVPATPALHNRARFFLDNIVAFSQVDKKSISLTSSTGGTASGMSDTTAVGGQIIPLTVTPDTGYALEGFTANGIPCEIADTNRPNAFILPEELTGPVVINAIFRPLIYHLFEDFEGGGTFTNNTNSWNSNPNHNNVTGWFAISNSTQGTVTGSLSTAQTRPGTTGAQSGLLTWGQTNANSRDFRFGYRPYSPVINATNYTHITFWARSSRTGAHNAVLRNSDNNDISMAWTITTANTWEEKTIALPAGARDQINYLGFGLSGPATTQTGQTLYIDDVRWIE